MWHTATMRSQITDYVSSQNCRQPSPDAFDSHPDCFLSTRVGSEILCGKQDGVHCGKTVVAVSQVCPLLLGADFRFGRKADLAVWNPNRPNTAENRDAGYQNRVRFFT